MVNEFHKAGIIWGDVKPGNVLIDMENNLWIIDFGGSYTPGWVDEKLMETVEGDLQELSKIINFINGREIETKRYQNDWLVNYLKESLHAKVRKKLAILPKSSAYDIYYMIYSLYARSRTGKRREITLRFFELYPRKWGSNREFLTTFKDIQARLANPGYEAPNYQQLDLIYLSVSETIRYYIQSRIDEQTNKDFDEVELDIDELLQEIEVRLLREQNNESKKGFQTGYGNNVEDSNITKRNNGSNNHRDPKSQQKRHEVCGMHYKHGECWLENLEKAPEAWQERHHEQIERH